MSVETDAAPDGVSLVFAWFGLAVLLTATVFASVDRMILALVIEPLRRSLGFTDTQVGILNGIGLTLVATLATFPMGWLADRIDRRVLLCLCVLVWSAATAACGLTSTFLQLFICSLGIAVGEAVLGPITYSLIPDLFPKRLWILANYVYYVAGVIGAGLGLTLSGALISFVEAHRSWLPPALRAAEGWRLSLVAVAIPGPLIALVILTVRLAKRKPPTADSEAQGLFTFARRHLRTLAGVFLGFGFAASASGTVQGWMSVVLVRIYQQTPAHVGIVLGLISIGASATGVLASGLAVRLLSAKTGAATPLRVAQAGVLVSLVLTPLYVFAGAASMIFVIVALQGAAMACALSLSPTLLQFIAPPAFRGRVIALGGMVYLIFLSASPLLVGATSDLLPKSPKSLLLAMTAVGLPCFAAGLLFLRLAEKTLSDTLAAAASG